MAIGVAGAQERITDHDEFTCSFANAYFEADMIRHGASLIEKKVPAATPFRALIVYRVTILAITIRGTSESRIIKTFPNVREKDIAMLSWTVYRGLPGSTWRQTETE